MTTDGKILDHEGSTKSLPEDLAAIKHLLSSALRTPGAKLMTMCTTFLLENTAKREAMHFYASIFNARRSNDALKLA